MATIDNKKNQGTTGKKANEKLPKPPKSWIAKRMDNAKRALRAVQPFTERFALLSTEQRPEFKVKAQLISGLVQSLTNNAEALTKAVAELEAAHYAPVGAEAGVKLAEGLKVWVRGQVWRAKYVGLFQPSEFDGLAIVSIQGKKAMAKSASGITVVEPVGAFTTRQVDYVAESREAA